MGVGGVMSVTKAILLSLLLFVGSGVSAQEVHPVDNIMLGGGGDVDPFVYTRCQLPEDTIVAIFADHGEEFWDHDDFEHGHTFYDELLRVPAEKVPLQERTEVVGWTIGNRRFRQSRKEGCKGISCLEAIGRQ